MRQELVDQAGRAGASDPRMSEDLSAETVAAIGRLISLLGDGAATCFELAEACRVSVRASRPRADRPTTT